MTDLFESFAVNEKSDTLLEGFARIYNVIYTNTQGEVTSIFSYPTQEKASMNLENNINFALKKGFALSETGNVYTSYGCVQLKNIQIF